MRSRWTGWQNHLLTVKRGSSSTSRVFALLSPKFMHGNQGCPEISGFYTKITISTRATSSTLDAETTSTKPKTWSKYLQQLPCALRLLFSLEDFPLGIGAIMAAEGKPTPWRADFPSSIKMCHSFSAAWPHSEMDALGREREQTLTPAPNTFRRCMECCLNNLISTSATPAQAWIRPQQPPRATGGDKQGGNGVPCPSPAAHTPSCHRKFITRFGWREGAHQARVTLHQRIPSMGRREGIWTGKISWHQQAAKGISFKKCPAASRHKAEIKDTPLECSERRSVLGRKGRGCGKGWEQLERNSSGTDRQAVTKSVNYLKNKLTQKRTSWGGGGGGRTSGYPSIMHKPAQGHCEKGSCGHSHGDVTRSWPQPTAGDTARYLGDPLLPPAYCVLQLELVSTRGNKGTQRLGSGLCF